MGGRTRAVVVALAAMSAGGCQRTKPTAVANARLSRGQFAGANLIIISLGNIGAEHMSLYGYPRRTTPKLDAWANEAIVFRNAFTPASWTLPAGASLFTSTYPYTHGLLGRLMTNQLHPTIETLAQVLGTAGYATAAFTGGLDYNEVFGQMRGFQVTDDNPSFTGFVTTVPQAQAWIEQVGGRKFFAFLHGYEAHCPFDSEKFAGTFASARGKKITVDRSRCVRGYRREGAVDDPGGQVFEVTYSGGCPRFEAARGQRPACREETTAVLTQDDIDYLEASYDEEVLYVDWLVGEFLDDLSEELRARTLILVFCEHGEMFAKHGGFGRAGARRGTLYDDVVHVPLMLRTPGGLARVNTGLVQLVDVMPTVLELLDVQAPPSAIGTSLVPLINDGTPVNEYVYAGLPFNVKPKKVLMESAYGDQTVNESIRSLHWKLIREVERVEGEGPGAGEWQERFELYNLDRDPHETTNVFEAEPAVGADLRLKLARWAKWAQSRNRNTEPGADVPESLIDDARRFGYQ